MKKLFAIVLSCIVISGCGVKPGSVEPPESSKESTYPRTYPDLSTDPAPHGGPAHNINR